jgi:hypothetical protein
VTTVLVLGIDQNGSVNGFIDLESIAVTNAENYNALLMKQKNMMQR